MFFIHYPYVGMMDERRVRREQTANARLIAASPKLYNAAWKTDAVLTRLFETDEFAALLASGAAAALIACRDLLRAALAEAAGEEVGDGE